MTEVQKIEQYVKENFTFLVHSSGKTTFKFIYFFEVDLPFQIPLPESRRFTQLGIDSKSSQVVTFSQVSFADKKNIMSIQGSDVDIWTSKCKVMVSDVLISTPSITEDDLSEAIDRGLKHMNSVIQAYRHTTRDSDVYLQSIDNSTPLVLVSVIDTAIWKIKNAGIINLNANFPYKKEIISDEDVLSEIERMDNVIISEKNPFLLVNDFQIDAQRFHKNALFKESIISSQTAIEVFLKTLLHQMLIEEGVTEQVIEQKLNEENNGFISLVKNEFHTRLGGRWDINKEGTPVGNWYKYVYKIRGRVVHAGYIPTHKEIDKAIDSMEELIKYVLKRIQAKKAKFPDLQKYFIDKKV